MLDDDVTASDVADELARGIYAARPELRNKGYTILVTDDQGEEIYRTLLEEPITPSPLQRPS